MKAAYFDCFSGASGDMILGALLDAGLDLSLLEAEIAKLRLGGYELRKETKKKNGIAGTQVVVKIAQPNHHHRNISDIRNIINNSDLSLAVKERSLLIFKRLAEAEAKVHQISLEEVHFHEVGALDAIIDVVGAVAGLEALGIEKVFCSPLHVGTGLVDCAHSTLPVPAPATAELIKGYPVYSTGLKGELLTPTGAAILTSIAVGFGPMPFMTPRAIGYGVGAADLEIPNLLRLFIGEAGQTEEGLDCRNVVGGLGHGPHSHGHGCHSHEGEE